MQPYAVQLQAVLWLHKNTFRVRVQHMGFLLGNADHGVIAVLGGWQA